MTTPTAEIDENAPRVESKQEFIDLLASGNKPKADWRIGTEHEKFGFVKGTNEPLPYNGNASVLSVLQALEKEYGWSPIREGEHLIGLLKDGASVSLEPGGQFELSGAPLDNIHQTCNEVGLHLKEVSEICDKLGVGFLGLGFSPKWSLEETPMMPKGRYNIMKDYMRKVGRLGHQMMFRSCTVQVNLDFESEEDMVKKFRVALALQPLATALFANSPFAEGRTNGFLSYRGHIWTDTDPDRTGMLPFVFDEGFGFEQYVDYALDVPMYFIRRDGEYLNCAGMSFRDFMDGKLPARPGELPTVDDFMDHLSTIFPEVRLKTFLEMRGADAGPWDRLCALPAFWVGLLYDSNSLDGAWDLVSDWTAEQREAMRRTAPVLGLNTPLPGGKGSLKTLALEVLQIARYGLRSRARMSSSGDDETGFLSELTQIAETGITPAERLLKRYHDKWNGSVEPAFDECAF